MNEWAARLLAVLPERLNSLNSSISGKPTSDTFDQFMQQAILVSFFCFLAHP